MENSKKKQQLFITFAVIGSIIILACFIWSMAIDLRDFSLPSAPISGDNTISPEPSTDTSDNISESDELLQTLQEDLSTESTEIENNNVDELNSTPQTSQ